jgi:hypothetical protein
MTDLIDTLLFTADVYGEEEDGESSISLMCIRAVGDIRKQTERADSCTESLRSLASYVGAGGYNADDVDAGVFEEKIRWGIGEFMARLEKANAELAKMREQKPVAWMHDKDGRVDTCHNSVKELWIKVGQKQNTPFMRELVPCRVEHYNIPLYAAPVPAPSHKCSGVPDRNCQYLAPCGSQCNKCGKAHSPMSTLIPAPAVPEELLAKLSSVLNEEIVFDPPQNIVDAIPENWDEEDKRIYKKFLDEAANAWGRRKIIKQARALLQSAEPNNNAAADRLLEGGE